MRPLVSVIIPTYNRSEFLPAAIVSASIQAQAKAEVLVVDDGSTDKTPQVLETFRNTLRIFTQPHKGLSAARNLGLANASGEYVVFLDSDDLLLPEKICIQSRILDAHPEIASVYSRWKTTQVDGTSFRDAGVDHAPHTLPTLLCRPIAVIHAYLFRTAILRALGGFDEKLAACEDWDLQLRLALAGYRFAFCPEVTAIYRLHSENMSHDVNLMLSNGFRVIEKAMCSSSLPQKYRDAKAVIQCIEFLEVARRCFSRSNPRAAQLVLERMRLFLAGDVGRRATRLVHSFYQQKATPIVSSPTLALTITAEDVTGLKDYLESYIKSL